MGRTDADNQVPVQPTNGEAKKEGVAPVVVRKTFVQETFCELIMSFIGAVGGSIAGICLLWPIVPPFQSYHGVDLCGLGAMFFGAPVGSLVGMSLVAKVVRRSRSFAWRALIFTLVACDLTLALTILTGTTSRLGHPLLIAGVSAFLGYKANELVGDRRIS